MKPRSFLRQLASYFVRGLIVTAPVAITLYVCWWLVSTVDGMLGIDVPGVGLLVALLIVTLVGVLASGFVTRAFVDLLDRVLERLPFVRLLYTSAKDLLNAFVGERRRFNRGVRVELGNTDAHLLGFVTADALGHLGLPGYVAVYVPQSYNFAANLILVRAEKVVPIAIDAGELMAFIVSGGVSGPSETPPKV
ncbi:MAG: DUF502 domain-containing protein [Gemmatimonadales bacterium]